MNGKAFLDGRVTALLGKTIKVYAGGAEYDAVLRGRLLQQIRDSSPLAVGDNVRLHRTDKGDLLIEDIKPRQQVLARPDVFYESKTQIIAANLDQIVIISSVDSPVFKPGLIDRFLVTAETQNLPAVIIINKDDLPDEINTQFYAGIWMELGYKTIYTSARTPSGLDNLVRVLRHKTSVLAGHSGVGKSSLLNAIQANLNLKIRNISEATGKGVHATTAVRMFYLDLDGWVIDTPGIKLFGLAGIRKKHLSENFPEMMKMFGKCKFGDCLHLNEPGCAIKEAVKAGAIAQFRYKSYQRIIADLSD
jgi:ribosome biogenesis GTPase